MREDVKSRVGQYRHLPTHTHYAATLALAADRHTHGPEIPQLGVKNVLWLTPTRIERMALRKHHDAGISRSTTELRGHKAGLALSLIHRSLTWSTLAFDHRYVKPQR